MQKFKKHIKPILYTLFACIGTILTLHKQVDFGQQFPNDTIYVYITCILFILSIVLTFLPKDTNKKRVRILSPFIFLLIAFFMLCAVEICNNNMIWEIDLFGNICMNYLICVIFYIIFFVLFGSLRISSKFTSTLLFIFAVTNMYVKVYKGSPLLPWDLTAISTAANVANAFSYEIYPQLIMGFSLYLLCLVLSDLYLPKEKNKVIQTLRIIGCTFTITICTFFYGTDYFAKTFKATPDFFNQTRGYESKGALAEFIVNTKYLSLNKPNNYNIETLEDEVNAYLTNDVPSILEINDRALSQSTSTADVTKPNIIVIMNEAFSDLSVIGDFDTNQDYMPFINSLKKQDNTIGGYTYVSTIGTGTSNTEYEFLTGNSMAFLPIGSNAYQLYVNHTQPGLVSSLKDQGYSADAFHPYYKKNWNRVSVYENMGFEQFIDMEDMESYEKLRLFVSDKSDFEQIEKMYEERDTSKPFFLFNITMQNHSSYDQNANFTQQIQLENMDKDYPLTEQYLSLIKETDDEFANLISYFDMVDEPTIILMYGDHQPFIEDQFYEEVMGSKITELSDEDQQKRYITRFVLWANYDIPEAWIEEISVNYLSTLLCQVTGLETTTYQDFLSVQFDQYPVVSMMGIKDNQGNYYTIDEALEDSEILQLYSRLAYNNLIEDENRIDSLFYINQ